MNSHLQTSQPHPTHTPPLVPVPLRFHCGVLASAVCRVSDPAGLLSVCVMGPPGRAAASSQMFPPVTCC